MKTLTGVKTKACYLCGKDKPRSEYHVSKSAKDGLQSKCKACTRVYWQNQYKTRTRRDGDVTYTHCENCVFLRECQHNIWRRTFDPYCFVSSKYNGLYQQEYRKEVTA